MIAAAPALATTRTLRASATSGAAASATAELTIPTTTSAWSCCSTRWTAGTPVCGVSPSSAMTVVTS